MAQGSAQLVIERCIGDRPHGADLRRDTVQGGAMAREDPKSGQVGEEWACADAQFDRAARQKRQPMLPGRAMDNEHCVEGTGSVSLACENEMRSRGSALHDARAD